MLDDSTGEEETENQVENHIEFILEKMLTWIMWIASECNFKYFQ